MCVVVRPSGVPSEGHGKSDLVDPSARRFKNLSTLHHGEDPNDGRGGQKKGNLAPVAETTARGLGRPSNESCPSSTRDARDLAVPSTGSIRAGGYSSFLPCVVFGSLCIE